MATKIDASGPEKSRDEIMNDLLEAESKIDAWQKRIVFEELSADDAETQLDIDTASLLENSENPALTKKLWHNAQSAILANIEKGPLRTFALFEKGLFLRKRANTTDQKFSFKQANQVVWNMVDKWVRTNDGEKPMELGMAFWDMNEQFGHHKRKGAASQVPLDFDKQLMGLLDAPVDKTNKTNDSKTTPKKSRNKTEKPLN